MSNRRTVCIFTGSSAPKDPVILATAQTFGSALGKAGYDIIYGGGTQGVMGAAAVAAHEAGAEVTAVVLKKYAGEAQIAGAKIINVETESQRFEQMTVHASPVALFVLPGGPGALREALQGLEKAVYENGAPLVLVKTADYLDGIKQMFNSSIDAGLIKMEHRDKMKEWSIGDDLRSLLQDDSGQVFRGGAYSLRPE